MDNKMFKSYLCVSKTSAEIHGADGLEFVTIGQILQEQIPPPSKSPYEMIDPGIWSFTIKGESSRARECFEGDDRSRIFRVVRGDGSTDSTDGFIRYLGPPIGDSFEVEISASGERISNPPTMSPK